MLVKPGVFVFRNSLIVPSGAIRPIPIGVSSVNQTFPSAPFVTAPGSAPDGILNSLIEVACASDGVTASAETAASIDTIEPHARFAVISNTSRSMAEQIPRPA